MKLGLLNEQELEEYATHYLENNPQCTFTEIVELACGIGLKNMDINGMLLKILRYVKVDPIEKDGSIWNIEKRKWRYCLLTKLEKYLNSEHFFMKFGIINAHFGYPEDMESFLYDEATFDIPLDQKFYKLLNDEKEKINNEDSSWPISSLYPPYNE
jgi:hypothetical protein